jgi:hypothetical protein
MGGGGVSVTCSAYRRGRNAHKILVRKSSAEETIRIHKYRCRDNIKMNLE